MSNERLIIVVLVGGLAYFSWRHHKDTGNWI